MKIYKCKFVDMINPNLSRNVIYEPLGLSGIKTSWKFSTDFPIGCNAEISTDNIRFIKEDAKFLQEQYEAFGEGASVRLDVLTFSGANFSFKIDFSSYSNDGAFVEVGLKATPLKDKLSAIDGQKIKFENELANMLSPLNVTAKIRQKNIGSGFNKTFASKFTINRIESVLSGNFCDLNWGENQATTGFKLGQDITPKTDYITTIGGTTNVVFIPENYKSLISFHIDNNDTLNNAFHVRTKMTAKFRQSTFSSGATDMEVRLALITAYEIFYDDGSTAWIQKDANVVADTIGNNTRQLINDWNQTLSSVADYTTYNATPLNCTDIYCHIYAVPMILGESTMSVLSPLLYEAPTGNCQVVDCEIIHDLCQFQSNNFLSVGVRPLFDYINRTYGDTFVLADDILTSARLSTYAVLRGQSVEMTIKIKDIMQVLSLAYGLVFVENNGIYYCDYINRYFDTAKQNFIEITDFYGLRNYNEQTFDAVTIGEDESNLSNQAEKQIFKADKFFVNVPAVRKVEDVIEIKSNSVDYAGTIIFDKIISANGGDEILLIDKFDNYNWLAEYNGQSYLQLNEYLSNWRIVNRLKRWLYSFIPYQSGLKSENDIAYYSQVPNDEAPANTSNPITCYDSIFRHWQTDLSVKFDWDLITSLKNTPRALKIGGKFYFPISYECNAEPNTINITLKEYR